MCFGMAASAQTYEQVRRRNVWSASDNINGMRLDTATVSYAEIVGSYAAGEFRDTWQPQRSWSAGASTASIRHLEDMTLVGGFSFTQTQGYDMCGSMFISPGMFPVDVLEFTPGTKILQTYKFDGGLSYDLSSNLKVGAMMDFKSANIAKRKDLRHANYQLDMTVSPGVLYQDGDFTFGANYILRKVSETVEPKQVGTKVSSYYAFLDNGMMYGVYSVWSGSGLHLDEAGVLDDATFVLGHEEFLACLLVIGRAHGHPVGDIVAANDGTAGVYTGAAHVAFEHLGILDGVAQYGVGRCLGLL